jgi:hypothetical protein
MLGKMIGFLQFQHGPMFYAYIAGEQDPGQRQLLVAA